MFKSKEERVGALEDRIEGKAPKALLNLRSRRAQLVGQIASVKSSNLQSLLDETQELFFVEQAIGSLEKEPADAGQQP